MAAKKSAKKAGGKKKSTSKPAARKKAPAAKAGGKKAAAKPAGKKAVAKSAKAAPPPKAAPLAKPAAKPEPKPVPAISKPKGKGGISSMSVNMGHIMALKPRVTTSFRQVDFLTARRALQDEAYESIEAAARAVADRALETTNEGPPDHDFRS